MVEDAKAAAATEAVTQENSEAPEAKKHDVEYADEEGKNAVSDKSLLKRDTAEEKRLL